MTFRDRLYGKQLWNTINLFIIFGLYGVILIVPIAFPKQMWNIFTGVIFVLLLYAIFWQYYLRKMDQERRGKKLNVGWIDHRDGVGEEYQITIEDVQPIERLPKEDLDAADKFEKIYTEKAKQRKLIKVGFDEFQVPSQTKKLENKEGGKIDENV